MTRRTTFGFLMLCGFATLHAPATFSQSGFSNPDLRGNWTFSYDGTLINRADNTPLPVNAVGVITLDGQGRITQGVRYLNVAGQVIKQTVTGTYDVSLDGTGLATATVLPAAGESSAFPPTLESFRFVMNNRKSAYSIGVSVKAANGQDLGLLPVVRITIVRQNHLCWNDC